MTTNLANHKRCTLIQALCAQSHEACRLWQDLIDIQTRLGTSSEGIDDISQARVIAHRLNNLLCCVPIESSYEEGMLGDLI